MSEFALKPIFDKDPIQPTSTRSKGGMGRSLLSSRSLTRTRSNDDVGVVTVVRSEFALKPIFDKDPIQQHSGQIGHDAVGVCSQADL